MKKHNFVQILKNKGFYVALFIAVVAIATVTVVGLKLKTNNEKNQNLVDLNSKEEIVKQEDTDEKAEGVEKQETVTDATTQKKVDPLTKEYANDDLLEFDVGSYTEKTKKQEASNETKKSEKVEKGKEEKVVQTEQEEKSVSVMQPKVSAESLKFSKNSSLSWPVKGNIIMPFSVEKVIHYATLGEWKTNPAVIISSEKGTDVIAAVKGIVSSIENRDETGITVTMDIGNGYEIVYGQLEEVTCEKGDIVEEGTVIGKIAKPTKFYSVEGTNLYLQLKADGNPVDPMLFLAGE